MTEDHDHSSQRVTRPKLQIMDWNNPSSHHTQPKAVEEDISPQSRGEGTVDTQVSPVETEVPSSSARDKGDVGDSFQRYYQLHGHNVFPSSISSAPGSAVVQHAVSSTSGSVVSSAAASPVSAFAFTSSTNTTAEASIPVPHKGWGELFDENGYATHRLGQVLRGLAKYMIEEYPPKNSLVITPDKLGLFYSNYRLDSEVFPFHDIFKSKAKDANDRISDFYSDLDCEHHLVHEARYKPLVPALTPAGFAQYITLCILAYPNEESRRLEKIVQDVDLTADDGTSDRLPKSITRSFLPAKHDANSRKLLYSAIDDLVEDMKLSAAGGGGPAGLQPATVDKRVIASSTRHNRRKYVPPMLHTIGDELSHQGYDSKTGRKRFTPGALHTIGDESSRERRQEKDQEQERDRDREPDRRTSSAFNPNQGPPSDSKPVRHRHDDYDYVPPIDLKVPPDRLAARPGQSRTQSYPHSHSYYHHHHRNSFSQPSTPSANSAMQPPPPMGARGSVSSIPPPPPLANRSPVLRALSSSVPDVRTSSPSSTVIFTPSTFSSASVSPSLDHGTGQVHREPSTAMTSEEKWSSSAAVGGFSEVSNAHWTSGGGAVMSPGIGTGLEKRLERQQLLREREKRRDMGGGEGDRGPTWEEFLRSQKAGAGTRGFGGGCHGAY
ncbi:uncharacterized protein BCR38DRAFT_490767 [Pseudomassariella vexata]|uniref:DUF7514 domain-containing protein n=1 Tax=Pseudomassariella vexata TaxID=1141098 RepID=A0A1Y2DA13_9PEZI|nr:uncharacterized protein BCR38DRAFT_490767 [Pseudomassariella vexata]ORY56108.1 hypothetical protein BCR38DRAFT_490767 [Pseudomassariella vexata]